MQNGMIQNKLFGDSSRAASIPDKHESSPISTADERTQRLENEAIESPLLRTVLLHACIANAYFLVDFQGPNRSTFVPMILRFENEDLLIQQDANGKLKYSLGPVETNTLADSDMTEKTAQIDICWWKRDSRVAAMAGETLFDLEASLTQAIFTFESKVLTIDSSGISLKTVEATF